MSFPPRLRLHPKCKHPKCKQIKYLTINFFVARATYPAEISLQHQKRYTSDQPRPFFQGPLFFSLDLLMLHRLRAGRSHDPNNFCKGCRIGGIFPLIFFRTLFARISFIQTMFIHIVIVVVP